MFPILTCLGLSCETLGDGLGDLQRLLATAMILRFYYNRCLLNVEKVFLCVYQLLLAHHHGGKAGRWGKVQSWLTSRNKGTKGGWDLIRGCVRNQWREQLSSLG